MTEPRNFFEEARENEDFKKMMDEQLRNIIPDELQKQLSETNWKLLFGDFIIFSVTHLEHDVSMEILKRAHELIHSQEKN